MRYIIITLLVIMQSCNIFTDDEPLTVKSISDCYGRDKEATCKYFIIDIDFPHTAHIEHRDLANKYQVGDTIIFQKK